MKDRLRKARDFINRYDKAILYGVTSSSLLITAATLAKVYGAMWLEVSQEDYDMLAQDPGEHQICYDRPGGQRLILTMDPYEE